MEKIEVKKELPQKGMKNLLAVMKWEMLWQKGHEGVIWTPGNAKPSCAIWETLTLVLTSYQSISSSQGCYYVTVL